MEISFKYKKRKINFKVKKCGLFGRVCGLMFRRRESALALLLFDFKKPRKFEIHSFFCPVFLAVWLDDKDRIIEKRVVQPWQISISPKKKFCKLIEIPLNTKYKKLLHLSSRVRKV